MDGDCTIFEIEHTSISNLRALEPLDVEVTESSNVKELKEGG